MKILKLVGDLAFFGDIGKGKKRQKSGQIRLKITEQERSRIWMVLGPFLSLFFPRGKAQNTVIYGVSANLALKKRSSQCCKNTVNSDVFEGAYAKTS